MHPRNYVLWFLQVCFCLALAFPVFASTITSDVKVSNISMSLSSLASAVDPRTEVYGEAETNPAEFVNWIPGPYTGGTWLQEMTGSSQFNTSTGLGSLGSNLTGIGPDPGLSPNGYLYQRANGFLDFLLDVPTTGTYTATLTADWTADYKATDQDVGFPVTFVSFHTWFGWSITNNFSEVEDLFLKGIGFVEDSAVPIDNYDSGSLSGRIEYSKEVYFEAGEQWVGLGLGSDQLVSTAVPLPASLLLFGSGLLGLTGWRRFKRS